MSGETTAMRNALEQVERALALPIPARTRIIQELRADMEDLRLRFLAEGATPSDALRRAQESVLPAEASLAALERLNRPLYLALTEGRDARWLLRVERIGLAVATFLVVAVQTLALTRADLLTDRSPFLLPVLGLGGLGVAVSLWKAFELWVKGDHRSPARGLELLPVLCIAILGLGVAGTLTDLYLLAGTLERGVPGAVAEALVVGWVARDAVLLSVAVLLALSGALAWFVFRQWLALVHGEHLDALGQPHSAFLKNGGVR